jgi:hypothetical protein
MVVPDSPADSATGCFVSEGIDGAKFVKSLSDDFGVTSRAAKTNEKERSFALPIWVI